MFNARLHLGHKVRTFLQNLAGLGYGWLKRGRFQIGTLNNNMKWALYGERLGVCVFDLDIARTHLIRFVWLLVCLASVNSANELGTRFRALNFIGHIAMRGGMILFITTNRETMFSVEKVAEEVNTFLSLAFYFLFF